MGLISLISLNVACLRAGQSEALRAPLAGQSRHERELIQDARFQRGFHLLSPQPGKRVVYGQLAGPDPSRKPAWYLAQWSSRFPVRAGVAARPSPGVFCWTNAAKGIVVGAPATAAADLTLAVNGLVEYNRRARRDGEPWVHLLVEQDFPDAPSLAALSAVRLQVEARLLKLEHLRTEDYSSGWHAAQFQIFLTVQNRNRNSGGFGDYLWFGIPLFDDRDRFPRAHKARDTGDTGKFIFTPAGAVFTHQSAHDRDWIRVDKDLRPLLLEALAEARMRGFLKASGSPADYHLSGVNAGWEVPGLFNVAMQVRGLSLKIAVSKTDSVIRGEAARTPGPSAP